MFALTREFGALYVATMSMQLGFTLLITYFALRLEADGVGEVWGGALMAASALGMVAGARVGYWLIDRVTHMPAFVASAGIIVSTVLCLQLSDWLPLWLMLRFVFGLAITCQLMVMESWLNDCAPSGRRGSAMSLYMVAVYGGMIVGQLLLSIGDGLDARILTGIAIAYAIGMVPLALHRGVRPRITSQQRVRPSTYLNRLRQSLGTALVSGILNGSFFSLTPVFIAQLGYAPAQVGQLMALTVAGGLLAQFILGRLFDLYSRVALIRLIATLLALAYAPLAFLDISGYAHLLIAGGVIGFLQFCFYPLGVAHANENLEQELRISVAGMLIVMFGIGATIGPLVAGALMDYVGPQALYQFGIAVTVTLAVLVGITPHAVKTGRRSLECAD
ncbi:putative MFS-type transporter YcaD [compost metagenome]|uniref:Predicted arabinose efflux permease, MFS family n=1 Tax=Pseudomonas jinjuensis TaxID=198616 RepID=A0A1H0DKT2_9PSED|nr:MFS transporter [Pseudomonas jinjuensis]SDN70752.1 Predicted arabinose efflux permease, MFS family [Pseudomonas jinjuensis]